MPEWSVRRKRVGLGRLCNQPVQMWEDHMSELTLVVKIFLGCCQAVLDSLLRGLPLVSVSASSRGPRGVRAGGLLRLRQGPGPAGNMARERRRRGNVPALAQARTQAL